MDIFLYSNKFFSVIIRYKIIYTRYVLNMYFIILSFFLNLHHQLCKKYVGLLTRLKSDNKIATKSLNTVR